MNYYLILFIVLYIILIHFIAKFIGTKREIGYGESIFWSVLLTPIVGFIITISSKSTAK